MATAFETEMGVMPELSRAVQEMDWCLPTDIQSEAVPMILGGGDVLMAAETGSGKTGAFCLPILQMVYETLKDIEEGRSSAKRNRLSAASGSSSAPTAAASVGMSVFDRTPALAIDGSGTLCQSRDAGGWHGARASRGVGGSGRYYYEARVTDEGLCRLGWSTSSAKLELGTCADGFGFGGTGMKSHNRQFEPYGESFGLGDVIGCCLDLDRGEISWCKNGKNLGVGYVLPDKLRHSTLFFPAVALKNAELRFEFAPAVPTGYVALQGSPKALPNPSDAAGGRNSSAGKAVSRPPNAPLGLILEPSRELAEQTAHQIAKFKRHMPAPCPRELLLVGGAPVREQSNALLNGVDLVVATPGRLKDLVDQHSLILSHCRFLVLDECDGLISAGHEPLIHKLHKEIPRVGSDGKRMQMVVCSATLHSFEVKKLAEKLMYFPTWIDLKGQDSVPETVHHVVCPIDPRADGGWKALMANKSGNLATDEVHRRDKINLNYETPETMSEAVKLLKPYYVAQAIRKHKMDRALVFCRTKIDCDNLENYLKSLDRLADGATSSPSQFSCVCLHGDRRPAERSANLQAFKNGEYRFLISTDVAARGIDVSGLPFVINVTLPDEKQNYVHRIGRVGRAARMGLAISLVSQVKEKVWYHSNCASRGKGCTNTDLTIRGGCCIWYNEVQLIQEIEEHLGVTIESIETDMAVPINEFDGVVTYGEKARTGGGLYQGHVASLAPAVAELAALERQTQTSFLNLQYASPFMSG